MFQATSLMVHLITGTKVALIHMAKRGGGTIVNTASFYGVYPEA